MIPRLLIPWLVVVLTLLHARGAETPVIGFHGGATQDDVRQVRSFVRARFAEPMLHAVLLPDGTLEIQAGHKCGLRCGSGIMFWFRKIDGKWRFIRQANWIS
jgi:hypothetical protein